jgi:hypothetical protein
VSLPLLHLTLTRAVPLVLALRTPLCSSFATIGTFGVFHKLLENIRIVKFHYAVHIFLHRVLILIEESTSLILSNLIPVPLLNDLRSVDGHGLHNEAIFLGHRVLLRHRQLFESPQKVSKHGQLVKDNLIHILSQPQEVRLPEGCDLILAVGVLAQE